MDGGLTMSEPITLYPVAGGTPLVTAAPSYAAELVAAGHYAYEPIPEPAEKAPAPDVTEAADEKPAAEKPKATAKTAQGRKGQL